MMPMNPEEFAAQLRTIKGLIEDKDWESAWRLCTALLETYPYNTRLLHYAYVSGNRMDGCEAQALKYLHDASVIDPSDVHVKISLGRHELMNNEAPEKALGQFELAHKDVELLKLYIYRLQIYTLDYTNKSGEADELYKKAEQTPFAEDDDFASLLQDIRLLRWD